MVFSSKSVLIVEDNGLLSIVEKQLIQKMGHRVIATVEDGAKALKIVEEKEPDILVVDVKLDGPMDGIQTVKEIRKKSDVPVIYLSGYSDPEVRSRAKEVGFSGYLTKPVRMDDLKVAFEKAFQAENVVRSE
ncbi:MAG TPA: response regulator [Balneolaceae bacterium]|nr:response regulator [Balneolaceae bacterium]